MKIIFCLCCLLALAVSCTTKSKARAQAESAFNAGKAAAEEHARVAKTSIVVSGDVRNPVVPWKEGMTLADAILAAGWRGLRDPARILVTRDGQTVPVAIRTLLRGEDNFELLAGDTLVLER